MNISEQPLTIFWFRRDLRWIDNHGFYKALMREEPVLPVFIFDKHILDELPKQDNRLIFIHRQLDTMREKFEAAGGTLWTTYDTPEGAFKQLFEDFNIAAVYTNEDYEPYAIQRDAQIAKLCEEQGAEFKSFKDQVIAHKDDVMTQQGKFYSVFTPYKRAWYDRFNADEHLAHYRSEDHLDKLAQTDQPFELTAFEAMGHVDADVDHLFPNKSLSKRTVNEYDDKRDYPALQATSRLGIHLRHGTLSVRRVLEKTLQTDNPDAFANELIWREFYMQVLYHNPQVVDQSFKAKYDDINWENNEKHFEAW
ncbi:MAG: deoxyribodipyrimidine photo-lyase, partial [Bacteroidota bacterium]